MPFPLLQSILGATFVVVWLFIAYTYFSDKVRETRSRREPQDTPAPHYPRAPGRRHARRGVFQEAGASS